MANVSVFRFHPQDSLAGGPPARWFVILSLILPVAGGHQWFSARREAVGGGGVLTRGHGVPRRGSVSQSGYFLHLPVFGVSSPRQTGVRCWCGGWL